MSTEKNQVTALELLWGGGGRPSRGPKPKLSLEQIAHAAIEVADAEGLAALSMQRVAAELGFTTMSLYRYVPGKEQLLEVMSDIAVGQPPPPVGDGDPRGEIERWVRGLWEVYRSHPWLLRVQVSGPPQGPNQTAWFEAVLRPLDRAGLEPGDMIAIAMFLLGACRELARTIIEIAQARDQAGVSAQQAQGAYADVLRNHADADRFPVLARLASGGVFDPVELPDDGVDLDLHFGVQRLLDGVETYIRRGE
jgi:AcrR family transcriptional regulator